MPSSRSASRWSRPTRRARACGRASRSPGRSPPTASPTPSSCATRKFSDGSPVTVDDVVFSCGKLNDPSAAYQLCLLKPVKSIEKVDDKPSGITLNEPYTPFLSVVVALLRLGDRQEGRFREPTPTSFGQQAGLHRARSRWRAMSAAAKVVLVHNPNYWEHGRRRPAAALSRQGRAALRAGEQFAGARSAERRLRRHHRSCRSTRPRPRARRRT